MRVGRYHAGAARLSRPALLLVVLLFAQLALGGLSYFAKFTASLRLSIDLVVILTTSHLAVGALMLAAGVALTLRSYRLSTHPQSGLSREVLTEQYSV
jgi:hypothetical protein